MPRTSPALPDRSSRIRTALLALPVAALLLTGCAAEIERPSKQYSIQDFLGNTSYTGLSFSPDGTKVLVSSDSSGVFNAFALPVAGGAPLQLTHSETDSVFVRGYFPGDERFLYSSDSGGDELDHLFVRETDGNARDLTPGEKLKAIFLGWAHDDGSFYVSTNERDPRFFDIYEYERDDYGRSMIYRNEQGLNFADASPDGRLLALAKTITTGDSDIYLYDRDSEQLKLITEHEGEINHSVAGFTPDGAAIVLRTDADNEFMYLVRQNLESGARDVLLKPEWDVRFAGYSDSGNYLLVGVDDDGRTRLEVLDSSGEAIDLPDMGGAEISSADFSADDSVMAFYASSSRAPRDLFVREMPAGEPRQLTRSLNANIDPADLVDAEVKRFKSFDGLEVPGILYKPHQASKENPSPAIVAVHGGPGGQSRVGYSGLYQYLVNNGYVVYAINNRGSSGYGKTFYHLDDRKHGEGDLDDCVFSKRMLIDTGYVDPEKIGILGGSYGGYMVLAALTFRPEEFAAGVDLFGISNWVRTMESIPPWWESFRKALEQEMGPVDQPEFFRAKSPLFHSENIVRPLMVLQGANDPRVIKAESDDIVEAVKKNDVPVEYVVFEDEGHGFEKKENRERGYAAILDFLDLHLRGES
ncbi:MAG: S9 family peptidase [bacterium]|nr:S9 family peptidase [bacterium]